MDDVFAGGAPHAVAQLDLLWEPGSLVDRSALPSAGKMISDQTGIHVAPETQEAMAKRYAPDL